MKFETLLADAVEAYSLAVLNEDAQYLIKRLLGICRDDGYVLGILRKQAAWQRVKQTLKTSAEFDKALNQLEKYGFIRVEERNTEGRLFWVIAVNPNLMEVQNEQFTNF
jgi:hypothetical protein